MRESSFCEKKKFDVAVTRYYSNQSWMGVECVGSNKHNEKKKKSSSVSWIVNACYTMRSHEFAVCWIDINRGERKKKFFVCQTIPLLLSCPILYTISRLISNPVKTPSSQVQVAIFGWFIVNLSGHIYNKRKELLTTFLVLVLFDRSVYWFTIDIYAICRNLISNFRGVFPRKTHTHRNDDEDLIRVKLLFIFNAGQLLLFGGNRWDLCVCVPRWRDYFGSRYTIDDNPIGNDDDITDIGHTHTNTEKILDRVVHRRRRRGPGDYSKRKEKYGRLISLVVVAAAARPPQKPSIWHIPGPIATKHFLEPRAAILFHWKNKNGPPTTFFDVWGGKNMS